MFNTNVGIRASYYLGLADVVGGADLEFKNRGIGISLLSSL